MAPLVLREVSKEISNSSFSSVKFDEKVEEEEQLAQQIHVQSLMGRVCISSWYPKFNGGHFGLPPSSIHNDWTGWQIRVNYDVFAQAPFCHFPGFHFFSTEAAFFVDCFRVGIEVGCRYKLRVFFFFLSTNDLDSCSQFSLLLIVPVILTHHQQSDKERGNSR